MHAGYDLRPRLQQVAVPTLVIAGVDDFLFSPKHAEAGAAALPQATLRILPGVGHDPHREALEDFIVLVRGFQQ